MEKFTYVDLGPTTTTALQRAGFRLEVRHDGWYTDDAAGAEAFLAVYDPTDDLKALYWPRVRAEVEQERMKYLTPGVAKAGIYQAKAREVERYEADSDPQPSEYPLLMAEIGARLPSNATLHDAYLLIATTAEQWTLLASMLEFAEGHTLRQISVASTPIEVTTAYDQVGTWAISTGSMVFESTYLDTKFNEI